MCNVLTDYSIVVPEDSGHSMSTIGEQSSPENDEGNEEHQSGNTEEIQTVNDVSVLLNDTILENQPENELEEDNSRRSSGRYKTNSNPSPEPQV